MSQTSEMDWLISDHGVERLVWVWFALTAVSVVYVAYDVLTAKREMPVMRWTWVLGAAYTGPVGGFVYWLSRDDAANTGPVWKLAAKATIHCLVGCGTGVVAAMVITSLVRLPFGVETLVEYVAAFVVGLFVFQALLTRQMVGCGYWNAVRISCLAQGCSMNAVMAGMIPIVIIVMSRDMRATDFTSSRFWGTMALSLLVGAVLSYPVNWWLVKYRLHPGMVTQIDREGAPQKRSGILTRAR